jgi:HD superfamily phosphohydrolase
MSDYGGVREIDGWRVIREIDRGHFGVVFVVTKDTDVECALKMCLTNDDDRIARLRIEVDVLGKLEHPGIPKLCADGSANDPPYLVMSLAPGKTIKQIVSERLDVGAVFGDVEAMRIIAQLLDALSHLRDKELAHRDIKDANVLYDAATGSATLIDFGFAKPEGLGTIRTDDSFWRAGSALFSPISKLDDSALASASHDVFAIGVLAYRMVTGAFPWHADKTSGVAALRELQRRQPLATPVTELNSRVHPKAAEIIADLLEMKDNNRRSASESLRSVQDFLRLIAATPEPSRRPSPIIKLPHVVRDPVYGDIRLTEYERKVIDAPQMQRLRGIKQLGLTDMVYPGATHSRLSHSIGCLERVEQILSRVERQEGVRLAEEVRLTARLYALVHDVTHVPFGHTIEDELGYFVAHDRNSDRITRLLEDRKGMTPLGDLLRSTEYGKQAVRLMSEDEAPEDLRLMNDLVGGVIGADVLDYIDRDAHYCGLDHRIDSAIYRQYRLEKRDSGSRLVSSLQGRFGLKIDREFTFETVLRERYAMFLKVYTHRAKIAISALLGKALSQAISTEVAGARLTEPELEWLSDEVLLDRLRSSADDEVSWLGQEVAFRRMPRAVYRAPLLPENRRTESDYINCQNIFLPEKGLDTPANRAQVERRIAIAAKVDPVNVIVYCPNSAPGYRRVLHWFDKGRGNTETRTDRELYEAQHLGLWDVWVFVTANLAGEHGMRRTVAEKAAEFFGQASIITSSSKA